MYTSGSTCLHSDCCFSELARYKTNYPLCHSNSNQLKSMCVKTNCIKTKENLTDASLCDLNPKWRILYLNTFECTCLFACLSLCTFSSGSVLLRYTDCDYPFGIFKLFIKYNTCFVYIGSATWVRLVGCPRNYS